MAEGFICATAAHRCLNKMQFSFFTATSVSARLTTASKSAPTNPCARYAIETISSSLIFCLTDDSCFNKISLRWNSLGTANSISKSNLILYIKITF